ncbi:MAG: metallophosphoesterase [Ilumatobacteraceae bacterium]|nr:metallophosphoesterase [Ilumatobacteraceae bacterium]
MADSDHAIRDELGGAASSAPGACLASLIQLTDLHVLDAASPNRAEWVELEGHDPLWRPLLHMHRPYDALTAFGLHAHIEAIAAHPIGPVTARPYDLAVSTGDNIDNAQRNELDAYLAVVAGGTARLDTAGSAQDADTSPWPYWSPDPTVDDTWRALGYPLVDDFVSRTSAPIVSAGLGIAWTSVPGNHDLLLQGTALPNPVTERLAGGASKSLRRPDGFTPADPLALYLDAPEQFSAGPGRAIAADPRRRSIDRREWVAAHIAAGATGFDETHVADGSIDTVIDLEHVRLILLDTNHPDGDYQGSIGLDQLAWLDDRLTEVERIPGRLVVLASHHGADSLVNVRGDRPDRVLGAHLVDVAHRHPCVVAWLVGHRHIHRIEPRPGPSGGFWEITTASVIDWPSQTRAIEIVRHDDGSIEIVCTLRDHGAGPGSLAALHRDLAHRFASTGVATRMAGREGDGNVRLLLPPR